MSIVPYANNRQVVLRHNDSIVLYDPYSKQFGVASQRGLDLVECPYCHQPLRREEGAASPDHGSPGPPTTPGFVSPEYFRMLQDSHPGSSESSAPPSPRRRLVEPVRQSNASRSSPSRSEAYTGTSNTRPEPPNGISASAFSPGYFTRFFVVEKELGRGGKGVVLLVTHVLDEVDLGQYACKRVPVGNDHSWLTNVLNEVRLLEHLSHQHLVYYKHVWLEDVKISTFGPSVPCVFILQQYCNAGDLHQYIVNPTPLNESNQSLKERVRRRSKNQADPPQELHGRKLRFEEIYSFFKDITSGLNHLHVNGFIHRDLKPSNCLLHDSGKGIRALVSDFGEVQIENMVRKSTGTTGTVSYCAPEVLRKDPATGALGNFTTKSDIFSLGMILYFLCFARLPYINADHINEDNEDIDLLRDEIVSWTGLHEERKLRPDLPEQLYTFLRRLLSLDPDDRPSAEDILLGIKTGAGLDEISDTRPKSAAHMFDDLSASSRISPVDSPRPPSTPSRKHSTSFMRPTAGLAKSRLSSSYSSDRTSKRPSTSPPTALAATTPTRPGSEASNDRRPLSPSGSLILRSQFSSPTRLSHHDPPQPDRRESYALPWRAHSPSGIWTRISEPAIQRTCKSIIFILKVLSLNAVCSPMAANPSSLYTLLALATLDAVYSEGGMTGLITTAVLAAVHVVLLLVLSKKGVLCASQGYLGNFGA